MSNVSLFGYQSNNPAARGAFDLCMIEEEKRTTKKDKPAVYNILKRKFQTYEEFYGKDSTDNKEGDE